MANVHTLLKEARKLEARSLSRCRDIPGDAVDLAHAGGMEVLDPWQEDALRSEAARILGCAAAHLLDNHNRGRLRYPR